MAREIVVTFAPDMVRYDTVFDSRRIFCVSATSDSTKYVSSRIAWSSSEANWTTRDTELPSAGRSISSSMLCRNACFADGPAGAVGGETVMTAIASWYFLQQKRHRRSIEPAPADIVHTRH